MISKSMEIIEYVHEDMSEEQIDKHEKDMISKGYEITKRFHTSDGENIVIQYIKYYKDI